MSKKTELKAKIEELIDAYHENAKTQSIEIQKTITSMEPVRHQYKEEGLKESLHNQLDPIIEGWKSIDQLYNQKFHEIVSDAEKIFKENSKSKEIPDHAVKMGNALKMLDMINPDSDEKMYMILKEFVDANDFDSLKIFKEIIGQNVEMENASGEAVFGRTFGSFNQHETTINLFSDLHEIGSSLFLHKRQVNIPIMKVGIESFGVPMDGYSEEIDEINAINCGDQIDKIINANT